MTAATTSKSPLAVRDFRLLWLGEAISTLGDQFALIALPWLALLLTGSPLALGAVMATMAVPRAVLMLIGGAYVDRLSPRKVMLVSNAVRLVAVTALGLIVLAGVAELWMLVVFALVFGIADAFFFPAQTAIVPSLVNGEQLQKANAIVQGTAQFSVLLGPAIAGLAIAVLGTGTSVAAGSPGQAGVALAFLLDGLTFAVSIVTLLLITNRPGHGAGEGSVLKHIGEGVRFVAQSPSLRLVMGLSVLANLLITGPFQVGLPLLAYSRLPEGAAAFGLMTSAFGGGSLLGLAAAMTLPPLPPARFAIGTLGVLVVAGLVIAVMGAVYSTLAAAAVSAVIGVCLGYTNIAFLSWIQRRIPRQLMGRVMSLLMFGSMALTPISIAIAGAAVTISLEGTFLAAGLGMSAVTVLSLLSPTIRHMGLEPVIDDEPPTADTAPTANAEVAPAA